MAVHPAGTPVRNVLSLCAGVGGLELGIALALHHRGEAARGICYVERELAAAASLVASMEAGWLHPAPVWSNMLTFDARPWRGLVHILASGDPCQDNSVAGKRAGKGDDRWLADHVVRIFDESGAARLFRENVTGNADGQIAYFVPALEKLGCRIAIGIFSAGEVGATHRRERLFIMADRGMAHPSMRGRDTGTEESEGGVVGLQGSCGPTFTGERSGPLAHPDGRYAGTERQQHGGQQRFLTPDDGALFPPGPGNFRRWLDVLQERADLAPVLRRGVGLADPDGEVSGHRHNGADENARLCSISPERGRATVSSSGFRRAQSGFRRVADGLANRVDRLRACGNGVVPLAAARAWIGLDALLAESAGTGLVAVRGMAA